MLTTVKLPRDLHEALEKAARSQRVTKSELLRAALRAELARLAARRRPTPYDLGKDLFGTARSGRSDLSRMRARDLLAGRPGPKRGGA
jgi:Arc/MetJ-type ribon-helix-helix transcriptional regulator